MIHRPLLLAVCLLLSACAMRPPASGPPPDGPDLAYVITHGWHTDLALPAAALEGRLARLRRVYPGARTLIFGFGNRIFARSRDRGPDIWAEALLPMRGERVVVRFDPQALHADLHVYRIDGTYLCAAECIEAVGFADKGAAQEHGRQRRRWMRATREALEAERSLSLQELARLSESASAGEPDKPEAKVVRPFFTPPGGDGAVAIREDVVFADPTAEEMAEEEREFLRTQQLRENIKSLNGGQF